MRTRAQIVLVVVALAGCSKPDSSSAAPDTSAALTPAPAPAPAPAAAPSATAASDSIVRGAIVSVSDTAITVGAAGGGVHVVLTPPVQVYERANADLSKVGEHNFVGVTSVPQPDGTQRATEIHIFPEELRGLGEGSRPMGQASGGGSPSTMTNGTVAGGGSRMTNGAVKTAGGAKAGGTITVDYQGGTQTITVPAGVTVTAIAPSTKKLAAGANVIVLAKKRADGGLESSRVMLAPGR